MRVARWIPTWRTVAAALIALGGGFACSGIITGPDAPDLRPRSMRIAPPSLTVARGDTARVTASLFDVTGAPAVLEDGIALTYRSDDTAIARIDATGLVTGVGGGTTTVRAAYGALTLGASVTVTVRSRLVLVSGDAQTAEQGDTLAQPVVVRALDAAGQPVIGDTVRFVVLAGGGAAVPSAAVTGADGRAQARWALGTALGTQRLRAERTGSDSVELTATATPGTSVRRVAVSATRTALVGIGDTTTLVARAYNVVDSLLPAASFTWTSSDTAVAVVAPSGLVTSRGLGAAWVRAASSGRADSVRITVGLGARLVILSGDAQEARWGTAVPDSLRVRLLDGNDQPVAGAAVTFEVSVGGGTVSPTAATTDAAGDAATRWQLGTVLGTHTVTARRAGFAPAAFTGRAVAGTFVTRVAITAGRTTLTGAGDSVRFTAATFNLADSLITTTPVAWRSSATGVVTVDDSGTVRGVASGTAYVVATADAGADSVLVTVLGAGARHWTGAVSDAWTLGANWAEGVAPTAADSAVIPATGVTNLPRIVPSELRALVSLNDGTITLDGSGDGALRIADALVLRSDVLALSCNVGARVVLTDAPTSAGPQPLAGWMACGLTIEGGHRALVDSLVLEGNGLGLSGTARLTVNGSAIRADGEQIHVLGGARLEMLDAADRVHALFANLVAAGQGDMLTAGELHVRQGLAVVAGGGDFVTGTAHRVVLSTTVAGDTATMLAAAGVRLGQLDVRMPTRIDGTLELGGSLVMTATGRLLGTAAPSFGLPERLRIAGNFTAASGATTALRLVELAGALVAPSFAPDTVAFIGAGQQLPLDGSVSGLRSVRISGTATARVLPNQRRFIGGDLVIDGDFGISETFVAAMGVNGSLRVVGNGILRLGGTYASLRVEGNALFDGRAMNGELAMGDIELRGDLVQRATTSPRSLRPAAGFDVYLIGSGAIDLATPDSSRLAGLQHWGNLTRTMRSDLNVDGRVRYDLNNVTVASDVLGAGGTRRITARGIVLGGGLTLRNVAYRLVDGEAIDLLSGPTFADFDPAAVQLELVRSGGTATLGNPVFSTAPTGAGRYVRVSDPDGVTNGAFALTVQGATPATHGGFAEAVAPAELLGWPSGIALLPLNLGADLRLAAGLQAPRLVRFPAPLAADVAVSIRALDTTLVRVALDDETIGTETVVRDAFVGDSTARYVVQALEGKADSVARIVASAPGFAPDTLLVTLTPPAVALRLLGDSILPTAGGADPALQLRVGVDSAGTLVPQAPRRGGPGADFTVRVDDTTAVRLRFTADVATIGADQSGAEVTFTLRPRFAEITPASLAAQRTGRGGDARFSVVAPAGWTILPLSTPVVVVAPRVALAPDSIGLAAVAGSTTPVAQPIAVTNAASLGTLAGLAAEVQYGAGASDWLAVSFDSTTAPATMTVTATPEFIPVGTWTARVIVTSTTAGAVSDTLTVTIAVTGVARIVIVGGDGQSVPVARTAPDSLRVRVLQADGQPVGGATVDFTIAANGGTLSPTTEVTDASGFVATAWTAGLTPGTYAVVAARTGFQSATFTLTVLPAPDFSISLVGDTIVGVGLPATVRAELPLPAPVGGIAVTLVSESPGRLTVDAPATRTVPAGALGVDFTVQGVSVGTATLRASASGLPDATLAFTVTNQIISLPTTLNVPLALTTTIPVQLATPAPAGGLAVTLVSSDPSRVGVVTSTVTVPAGATLASGTLSGVAPGAATITATAPGWIADATAAATTAQLDIVESGVALNATFGASMTVRLLSGGTPIAAPAPGLDVALAAANPGCVAVPATVTIPTGQFSVTTAVSYGGVTATPCATRVHATRAGLQPDSVSVSVASAPGITAAGGTIGSGLQFSTGGSLAASNYGATTVRIESADSSLVRVAPNAATVARGAIELPLTAPSTSFGYTIAAMEGVTGQTTLTISASGFTSTTVTVVVRGVGVELLSLPGVTTSFSVSTAFSVRIGALNAAGTAIEAEHPIRAGGVARVATLTSSTPAVGRLVTATDSGATVSVTVPVGSTRSGGSVSTGGVEFDPVGPGTTTISVTMPDAVATASASANVTVNAPGISAAGGTLGAGLRFGTGGSLGASNYGLTTTVRVESSDSSLVRVARDVVTPGTGAIEIPLVTPQTSFSYVVSAMEGVTGTATLTVSAPGFTTATATVVVRGVGVELLSVPTSTTALSPNANFSVRIGTLNAAGTAIESEYPIRAGGTPLVATVTNSNASVAQLVGIAGAAQSVTDTILVGSTRTRTGAANGGFEFDPVAPGSTTLTASIPGVTSGGLATASVTVTSPGLNAGGATLGAGLQTGSGGSLGASNYGTTTVRVESSDSSLVRIALRADSVARGAIDIPMTAPQTGFSYTIAAMEGVTGTATLTVSAPGFGSTTATVVVRGRGIELLSLPANTTSLSPNTPFGVRLGTLNAAGTAIESEYVIRTGGVPVSATVTNSNATVAQLIGVGGPAQAVTVTIPVGSARAPTGATNGGVELDPLSSGSTTIAVTAAGLTSTANASETVNVSAPGMTAGGNTLGAGLQVSSGGTLGASSYGTTTVRVQSSDSSLVRVAPNSATAGSGAIDIPMTAPNTSFSYVISAMEGVTGTATITVSAPGFTSQVAAVVVRGVGLELISVPTSTTALSGNAVFTVRIGTLNVAGTAIESEFPIRAGGIPLTATVTNSNAAVAQLQTLAGGAQSATATIGVGSARTPGSVASGGFEFDPIAAGTTTLTASIPGVVSLPGATANVTVVTPSISVGNPLLGAGLQIGTSATLGAPNYGTVTVRLESLDPTRLLVAPNAATTGAAAIDVPMTAPASSVPFVISALEGVTGTARLVVSAPGFLPDTMVVTIRAIGLDFVSLPSSIGAAAANTSFQVRVGMLNALGTALESEWAIRTGGVPIVATVTSAAPGVAQLVTLAGGTGTSGTVTIAAGQTRSPNGVASGGIALDPVAAGAASLTVTAPGVTSTPSATAVVTVTP